MNPRPHPETQTERSQREPLADALRLAGAQVGTRNSIRCPFHEDKSPSGSLYIGDDGAWRYKCMVPSCGAGGDVFDIRARANGTDVKSELKAVAQPYIQAHTRQSECARAAGTDKPKPKRTYVTLDALKAALSGITDTYLYANPETKRADMVVFRCQRDGHKTFLQAHQSPSGWVLEAPPKPWPIYNRTRVKTSAAVIVCEGEKCVHAFNDMGVIATTSPGGAGKAAHADWKPLAGKTAILWPDNDNTGIEHMRAVAVILDALDPPARVLWVDPTNLGLNAKDDIVQFLEGCEHPADELTSVLDMAEPVPMENGSSEVLQLFEDTISGKRATLPMPWPKLGKLTRALLPGKVTLVCGNPGEGKSLWLLEAFAHWYNQGIKGSVYELEDERSHHLTRALIQRVQDARFGEEEWVRENADAARYVHTQNATFLNGFGRQIKTAPDESVTHDDVLEWIKERCADGCRVLGVDPITAIEQGREPWLEDQNFITKAKKLIRATGTSLLLVIHPKKNRPKGGSALEDMAGGIAFARFCDCALWLDAVELKERECSAPEATGNVRCMVNRVIHIRKCRNGKAGGWEFGYHFDPKSLTFHEQGVLVD